MRIHPPYTQKTLGAPTSLRIRAENETRTRDPNLGKVVLYQLSYFRLVPPPRGLGDLFQAQRYRYFLNWQEAAQIFHPPHCASIAPQFPSQQHANATVSARKRGSNSAFCGLQHGHDAPRLQERSADDSPAMWPPNPRISAGLPPLLQGTNRIAATSQVRISPSKYGLGVSLPRRECGASMGDMAGERPLRPPAVKLHSGEMTELWIVDLHEVEPLGAS